MLRPPDGAEGAAGAEVAADQPQLLAAVLAFGAAGHGFGHVLVVEAVEAEAPQAAGAPAGRNRVGAGRLRQGAVEGRVEAGPLGDPGLPAAQPAHHPQGRTVVQRRQGHQLLQDREHGGIEPDRSRESLAAMDDPVAGHRQPVNPAGQGPGQPGVQHRLQPLLGGRPFRGADAPAALVPPEAVPRAGVHGDLEAGAAGVQHQHLPSHLAGQRRRLGHPCADAGGVQRQSVTSGASVPWVWA